MTKQHQDCNVIVSLDTKTLADLLFLCQNFWLSGQNRGADVMGAPLMFMLDHIWYFTLMAGVTIGKQKKYGRGERRRDLLAEQRAGQVQTNPQKARKASSSAAASASDSISAALVSASLIIYT